MKIILLKDVPKIGKRNEIKDLSEGYVTNFIIPRGLGVKATDSEIKRLNIIKSTEEVEKKIQAELLEKSLEDLSAITITIKEKTNEKGHLFAGVDKEAIVKEIKKVSGIDISPDFIDLVKPIKEVGEYIVPVSASGKKGRVKVSIQSK